MKFANPEIEVLRFQSEDVIATSGTLLPANVTGLFYIPAADYNNGSLGNSGYVSFNGTGGVYDPAAGGYLISNIGTAYVDNQNERNDLITHGGEMAAFIPASFFEGTAKNTFDAYLYNGDYYTNGISYYTMYYTS